MADRVEKFEPEHSMVGQEMFKGEEEQAPRGENQGILRVISDAWSRIENGITNPSSTADWTLRLSPIGKAVHAGWIAKRLLSGNLENIELKTGRVSITPTDLPPLP